MIIRNSVHVNSLSDCPCHMRLVNVGMCYIQTSSYLFFKDILHLHYLAQQWVYRWHTLVIQQGNKSFGCIWLIIYISCYTKCISHRLASLYIQKLESDQTLVSILTLQNNKSYVFIVCLFRVQHCALPLSSLSFPVHNSLLKASCLCTVDQRMGLQELLCKAHIDSKRNRNQTHIVEVVHAQVSALSLTCAW